VMTPRLPGGVQASMSTAVGGNAWKDTDHGILASGLTHGYPCGSGVFSFRDHLRKANDLRRIFRLGCCSGLDWWLTRL
jgi:hypothetical protein